MKTDSQIKIDVVEELCLETSINAELISVDVTAGIVTLRGDANFFANRWHAEQAVQRVLGVRALVIEVDEPISSLGEPSDAEIASAAKSALHWSASAGTGAVEVVVEDGWIILSGTVDWAYQREAAADAVRHHHGVKGLVNNIEINTFASESAVKSGIEAAMMAHAKFDAQRIEVEVQGDKVTLRGDVHSWTERELARQAACGVPGVRHVVDNIAVVY